MGEKKYVNYLEIIKQFEPLGYTDVKFINGHIFITRKCDASEAPRIESVIVIDEHNKTYYKYAEIDTTGAIFGFHITEGLTTQEHKILHDYAEYMGWLDE